MAIPTIEMIGLHAHNDLSIGTYGGATQNQDVAFTYTFENFFHPFVGELIEKLNRESLPGMLDPTYHKSWATDFFDDFYTALTSNVVEINHFPKEIDVRAGGPYANYNWELLFHIPLTIAVHLSKNQRFAEAQRWFHYIFDPTSSHKSGDPSKGFWKFLAFRQDVDVTQIDELLALLSNPNPSETEKSLSESILEGYEAIKDKPFQPHAVARTRHLAYQYCVVMKYLDNLIAWGDSLFRQDTIESINEATQRYVLAANLLGPRPQRIPQQGASRPKTFAELKQQGLDAMGNTLVDLEGMFPFNLGSAPAQEADPDAAGPLFGIGRTLYFCIPRNQKMLGYWDTVADRLFKIRNCMNIAGIVRQLALFEPALDPGLFVKAAAAGIDLGSMAGGSNQPISPVRSLLLIQKALELSGEVRGLGSALLSAIEKGDGERMALLRQAHEIQIQQMAHEVRFLQWKQAQEATTSLLTSRKTALERLQYYQRLLGLPEEPNAPDTITLDRRELTEENFDDAYSSLVGQYDKTLTLQELPDLKLAADSSPGILSGFSGSGQVYLTENEDTELNSHLPAARDSRLLASAHNVLASAVAFVPNSEIHGHYWGIGVSSELGGGEALAIAAKAMAEVFQIQAAWHQDQAGMASRYASYERRADEWLLQYNLAAHEVMQIGRQILTSLIAEQITYHEYQSIQKQIEQSQEVDRFLREKFTNAELYAWMQGEISRLYYEYYRFAFDTARKAEQTMKHELMRPEVDATDHIRFNYWDGGRKGLLSGEALYLDVKRMEMAYHENNKREYELTKHVSVRQLDPLALLTLKATGSCEIILPEWLFDLDGPGHYMRRIKNVSLSIPSVTGPYTSVNCTLSLHKSSVRKTPELPDGEYLRQGSDDSRFVDYFGTVQSIVTSSANNDSGMFETNLRDERFLPFEGAGAESAWKLELPKAFRQFDYDTISDVILHVRYTARQGGDQLREQAVAHLKNLVGEANTAGLALLFNLRSDFPTEWSAFVSGTDNFNTTIRRDYFPYFAQGEEITITGLDLYSQDMTRHHTVGDPVAATNNLLEQAQFTLTAEPDAVGPTQVLTRTATEQIFLVVRYSLEP